VSSIYKTSADQAKIALETVSPTMCLAKWNQVSLHLPTGLTNSCYHPPLHEIDAESLIKNPAALHNTEEKIKQTIEVAENVIEQGKKVIIFTNFTNTLNQIKEHFGKSAVTLDGSMSKPARQNSVDQFQENDKIKVFIGNLKAAGVGITLTAAEAVIMNDLSFVPADHAQAEDRAYRYGQKSNVSIFYPLFDNTIEGVIYDILNKKKNIISTVMGDNEDKGGILEEILNSISRRR
jgi:SNF2 family DNA or RNA helicase